MKTWLKARFGMYRGGADWITRSRVFFLSVAYTGIFYFGTSLIAFWVGAIHQIIGMILDGLDGWWARNIQIGGPTIDGQYIDQKYDKIFIWPSILQVTVSDWWYGHGFRGELSLYWVIVVTNLLTLDIISYLMHRRNWIKATKHYHQLVKQALLETGKEKLSEEELEKIRAKVFNKKHGAWTAGKIKFVLMCTAACIETARYCPRVPAMYYWNWLADTLGYASMPIMILAAICAWASVGGRINHFFFGESND